MPDHLLANLTDPQRQAVTTVDGPLLVLAGAGSGKTRVITRRAAFIAATAARAEEVLAITFTNKAAGEMRERIHALGVGGRMWVCTFHSLCARLLREFSPLVGLKPGFSIFDESDRLDLIRDCIKDAGLSDANWRPRSVVEAISAAKSAMLDPLQYAEVAYDFSSKTYARIYSVYQAALVAQNAVDFDDLLLNVARLLETHDDVRLDLSRRFRYLLVDEYQDTNAAQYRIAADLAREHRNICVTGDPDQSIYAWRGADIRNILDFERDYPDAVTVRLEQNYRSTPSILAVASGLISYNQQRKEKTLWTENDDGPPVSVWECEDEQHEAAQITEDIRKYCDEGGAPGDVAIFYRTNALTRVLEDALRRAKIPYQIARGVEFYGRREIKDALSYLRMIVNPADEAAALRAINTPARGIGKVTLERIRAHAQQRKISFGQALEECASIPALKAAVKKIAPFVKLMADLRALPDRPVQTIVEKVISLSGLEAALSEEGVIDNDRLANVQELVSAARQYDTENPEGSLADWLHQISLVSDQDMVDMAGGPVNLMTLHAAKGLEFPVVYIAGLEDGLLPHRRALDGEQDDMEEERRLCFVGITRAMKRLTLTHAQYRMIRGLTERTMASRFLSELPSDQIVFQELEQPRDRSRSHLGRYNEADDDTGIDVSRFQPGRRIMHPEYGEGQVLRIEPRGRSIFVRVRFPDLGDRSFALDHATMDFND